MPVIERAGCLRWITAPMIPALFMLPGCSFIYDADEFVLAPDAAIDAFMDPCAGGDAPSFKLVGIEPRDIYEGQGCVMEGEVCGQASRSIPVVVSGCAMAADATITLTGAGVDGDAPDRAISSDGRWAAFTVRVPVRTDQAGGTSADVTVTISQGETSQTQTLTVHWLDEFLASAEAADGTYDLATKPLAARYSRIEIDQDTDLIGTVPARFVATSEIILGGALQANGNAGEDGGEAGPGGCAGGGQESAGQCGASGGGPGGSEGGGEGSGGGGGGHAEPGNKGGGDRGGTGGDMIEDTTLTPLSSSSGPNAPRGHGGGGGGKGILGAASGIGGGGGGVIELTSWGKMHVRAPSAMTASGGKGQDCEPPIIGLSNAGGGGGGSGGAILLRAALLFSDEGPEHLSVDVAGGAGGAGCGGGFAGGAGSQGRVRIDLPHGDAWPASIENTPYRYRGPVLAADLMPIARANLVRVSVHGGVGATYWLSREPGPELLTISMGSSLTVQKDIELVPGSNELCVLVSQQTTAAEPEGRNCLNIAYIP